MANKSESLPKIKSQRRTLKHLHNQASLDTKVERYRESNWNSRFHVAHMKEYKDSIKISMLEKLALYVNC